MAINAAKVTLSFAQQGYGWTESYYLPTPSADLTAEFAKGLQLAQKRGLISGSQTTIPYVKVSNEDVKRDVFVGNANVSGYPGENSDAPDTAVLARRFAATPGVNSPLFLRGVWDTAVINGGRIDSTNAVWVGFVNSFRAYLISAGFGFLAKDPTTSFQAGVATLVSNPSGTVTIVCDNGIFAGIPVGTKIKAFISGVQGAVSVNGSGVWVVGGNATITSVNRIPMFAYTTGGLVSFRQLKFYPITALRLFRVVERKVGRPLYLSVGRSRARKLA